MLFHTPSRRARERLHLRIADRLEERGDASAAAVAHHLTRAGSQVEPARLSRWSQLAAGQALAIGAWSDAAIAADTALAALGPEAPWDQRADLHSLVSRAASHDFDLAVASRHGGLAVDLAEAHGDAARWAAALIPLARTLATNAGDGPVVDPTSLLRAYLVANPDADGAARAEVLALLSEIRASHDDLDGAAEAAAEAAVALPQDAAPDSPARSCSPKAWPTGPDSTCRVRAMPSSERRGPRPIAAATIRDLCRGPPGVGQPAPRPHRPGGGRNPRWLPRCGTNRSGGSTRCSTAAVARRRRPRRARPSRAPPRRGRSCR